MPQIEQLPYIFFSQLFWLLVVFGIIFFGIGRGMLPKIQSTVDAREKKIAEDLERAQAARAAAEETEAAWRARMDAARVEAAEGKIRDALNAARSEIEEVAAEAAQGMVARLTGVQVDKQEAAQAVKA